MVSTITKKDVLYFVGQIASGMLANPASSHLLYDFLERQNLIQQIIQDVQVLLPMMGFIIAEPDKKEIADKVS